MTDLIRRIRQLESDYIRRTDRILAESRRVLSEVRR